MAKKATKQKPATTLVNASGVKDLLKGETLHFLLGILLLVISVFMFLSFTSYILTGSNDQSLVVADQNNSLTSAERDTIQNQAGFLGAKLAYFFMNDCFGFSSYFIPLFFVFVAMKLMRTYRINLWRKFVNFAFLMIWLSIALTAFLPDSWLHDLVFPPGGQHGKDICNQVSTMVGKPGLFILIIVSAIFYLIYLTKRTIIIIRKLMHPKEFWKSLQLPKKPAKIIEEDIPEDEQEFEDPTPIEIDLTDKPKKDKEFDDPNPIEIDLTNTSSAGVSDSPKPISKNDNISDSVKPNNSDEKAGNDATFSINPITNEDKADRGRLNSPYDPKLDLETYKYPTLGLLKKYAVQQDAVDMAEQTENKDRITTILNNFGVDISSIKATVGPTITLYEITPAPGVRISKIKNLEDDIALSLSALGIRIIAPIPGKGTIGIEVPNKNPKIVSIESILNSRKFQESDYELPIALGKTITNEVYMVDLAKMPHLLVAGATGQGKSVGLNAIITSLLYKKHPSELKLVLVDPKKVEFSIYAPLEKYFLAKVADDNGEAIITEGDKVVRTLKSLCQEMDNRYVLLKKAHCRNLKEYNKKFIERQLNPENGHRFLPYIVVIIDEFGDLIMTQGKDVELPIARIAQLARAVGIHMVIATQRPTTNIITGTIKANFPARMAFKVTSQIDSRTILDQGGANQLIGRGDMLFLAGGILPSRVQCAFIDTPEVERINQYIASQQSFLTAYELPEVATEEGGSSAAGIDNNDPLDPLFEEAARLIVAHQQGSTSLIQRKFAIGYNRAGRLMDQLERMGIVGPINGSKPRDVLCSDEADLQIRLESFNLKS